VGALRTASLNKLSELSKVNEVGAMPSVDLYMGNMLHRTAGVSSLKRFGAHSYILGEALVFFRYADEDEWKCAKQLLKKDTERKLIYVLDDNLDALIEDPLLPKDYRKRVREFVKNRYSFLLEESDEVLLCSQALLEVLAGRYEVEAGFTHSRFRYVDPYWNMQRGGGKKQEGFSDLSLPASTKLSDGIAFLGTRSHHRDLDLLSSALKEIAETYPRMNFYTRLGKDAPDWLRNLPRTQNLRALPWQEYRVWVKSARFAVALYPTRDSAFNHSRSVNKVMEQALTGAVGIYSARSSIAQRLPEKLQNSLLAGKGEWAEKIIAILEDRELREKLAHSHARLAMEINRGALKSQAEFWSEASGLTLTI